MTVSPITLPGEGEVIVADTPSTGPHAGEHLPAVTLWGYDPDGNPIPVLLDSDGIVLIEEAP